MDPNSRALLSSPRTLEGKGSLNINIACDSLGYDPEELAFKTQHELKIQMGDLQVTEEVLEIRWNAFEENRRKKVKNVMDQRRKIIEKHSKNKGT